MVWGSPILLPHQVPPASPSKLLLNLGEQLFLQQLPVDHLVHAPLYPQGAQHLPIIQSHPTHCFWLTLFFALSHSIRVDWLPDLTILPVRGLVQDKIFLISPDNLLGKEVPLMCQEPAGTVQPHLLLLVGQDGAGSWPVRLPLENFPEDEPDIVDAEAKQSTGFRQVRLLVSFEEFLHCIDICLRAGSLPGGGADPVCVP